MLFTSAFSTNLCSSERNKLRNRNRWILIRFVNWWRHPNRLKLFSFNFHAFYSRLIILFVTIEQGWKASKQLFSFVLYNYKNAKESHCFLLSRFFGLILFCSVSKFAFRRQLANVRVEYSIYAKAAAKRFGKSEKEWKPLTLGCGIVTRKTYLNWWRHWGDVPIHRAKSMSTIRRKNWNHRCCVHQRPKIDLCDGHILLWIHQCLDWMQEDHWDNEHLLSTFSGLKQIQGNILVTGLQILNWFCFRLLRNWWGWMRH